MRALLGGAVAAAILASSSLALAAEHAEGVIKEISTKTMMLTLKNGKSYVLPKGFKEAGVKAGVKVQIAYETKNGKNLAQTVKIVK